MKSNPAVSNTALTAFDGAVATPRDVSGHTQWAFVFEVKATLAADAIFEVVEYDPLAANKCVHNPATLVVVKEISICTQVVSPAPNFRIVIPAGTVAGCIGSATTHCEIGPFVALRPVSGAANVAAVLLMTGAKR